MDLTIGGRLKQVQKYLVAHVELLVFLTALGKPRKVSITTYAYALLLMCLEKKYLGPVPEHFVWLKIFL